MTNSINGNYAPVQINGVTIAYDGKIVERPGVATKIINPQVNGKSIVTTDISTKKAMVKIPIRNTKENNELFDSFYSRENNIITVGDKEYINMQLLDIPDREDQEITEYIFEGDSLFE